MRLAEDSTKLILSMRVMRGLLKISMIGFAALAFSDLYITDGSLDSLVLAGILLGFGTLIGLIEFLVKSIVLRSPTRWVVLTSYLARTIILITSPITFLLQKIGSLVLGLDPDIEKPLVTEEQIMTLVDAGDRCRRVWWNCRSCHHRRYC